MNAVPELMFTWGRLFERDRSVRCLARATNVARWTDSRVRERPQKVAGKMSFETEGRQGRPALRWIARRSCNAFGRSRNHGRDDLIHALEMSVPKKRRAPEAEGTIESDMCEPDEGEGHECIALLVVRHANECEREK
jgi:hypothetical protein